MITTMTSKKQVGATQPKVPPQNECFFCKNTKELLRCRWCLMISYCAETGQDLDWATYKDIHRAITGSMKQEGDVNQIRWKDARDSAGELVSQTTRHSLNCVQLKFCYYDEIQLDESILEEVFNITMLVCDHLAAFENQALPKALRQLIAQFAILKSMREYILGVIFENNDFVVVLKPLHGNKNKETPDLTNSIGNKQSNAIQNIVEKKLDYIPKKIDKALDCGEIKVANISESGSKKLPGLVNDDEKNLNSVLKRVEDKSDSDSRLHRWDFFYINNCQVCHINNQVVLCPRCKMIAYCGKKHRKAHWPQHKNLCKVILCMLKETDATNLFDKLKTNDTESWTKVKIDLMLKAQSKLGRTLFENERQIFLFPKTCFECHESDSSILRTCECGVSLCKQHRKNVKHQNLCSTFEEVFKNLLLIRYIETQPLPTIAEEGSTITAMKTLPVQTKMKGLPNSIKDFIDYWRAFSDQDSEPFLEESHFFSELLSRPLTMLYVIQKLNFTAASSLTIHVIGATNEELRHVGYWEILLHWLPQLKEMKLAFVGPEINEPFQTTIIPCESCTFVSKKPALVFSRRSRYNEYYESKFFSKPDFIIGYNLDLHESELGISECTWKESILTLKTLGAPFIMTTGTEKRAQKDHERLCNLLEKPVSYDFCEVNPFTSLIPERDFETEELKYANNYITIYKEL